MQGKNCKRNINKKVEEAHCLNLPRQSDLKQERSQNFCHISWRLNIFGKLNTITIHLPQIMHSIARKVTQKIKSVIVISIIIFRVYKKEIATYQQKRKRRK